MCNAGLRDHDAAIKGSKTFSSCPRRQLSQCRTSQDCEPSQPKGGGFARRMRLTPEVSWLGKFGRNGILASWLLADPEPESITIGGFVAVGNSTVRMLTPA